MASHSTPAEHDHTLPIGPSDRIWYAAYGSNTLRARLMAYIEGADAEGVFGLHAGGRVAHPPADETVTTLRHALYFAGTSRRWPGSVAFVDPREHPTAMTYARCYLLQWQQIEDLVAHENGQEDIDPITHLPTVGASRRLPVGGKYDLLLRLGDIDGTPAVTVTTSQDFPRGDPHPSYLDAIRAGLQEARVCSEPELAEYFRRLETDAS
ncbi:MAG TPA: hypothetical protein VM307_02140 [Egibacteraceae bacterium]|nr:hypothetical protein [Egibacteraceae bacterium]